MHFRSAVVIFTEIFNETSDLLFAQVSVNCREPFIEDYPAMPGQVKLWNREALPWCAGCWCPGAAGAAPRQTQPVAEGGKHHLAAKGEGRSPRSSSASSEGRAGGGEDVPQAGAPHLTHAWAFSCCFVTLSHWGGTEWAAGWALGHHLRLTQQTWFLTTALALLPSPQGADGCCTSKSKPGHLFCYRL